MMKDKRYARVTCKSGFSVSIQAGEGKYCQPRSRAEGTEYKALELGFPSQDDFIISPYAENPSAPTETVYGYVPVSDVYLLISKHGGVVSGEVPLGVPVYGGKSYG